MLVTAFPRKVCMHSCLAAVGPPQVLEHMGETLIDAGLTPNATLHIRLQ